MCTSEMSPQMPLGTNMSPGDKGDIYVIIYKKILDFFSRSFFYAKKVAKSLCNLLVTCL